MRTTALFAALTLACCVFTRTAQAEDLLDLLPLALAQDQTLALAEATKRETDQDAPIARAALLPQASATQTLTDTHGGDLSGDLGHLRERELSATATQTLFSLSDIAAYRQARDKVSAGEQTLRSARLSLYIRLVQAYFDVLIEQDLLQTYEAYEDAYRREYEQTRVRLEQGLSAQVDMNQAKAYWLYIKSDRIKVANDLESARQALATIIGRPPGKLATLREDFPMTMPVPSDADAWVARAIENNPDIAADRASLSASEHAVTAARGGHLPTLQASFSYGKTGEWYTRSASDPSYGRSELAAGLTLSIPLFSGGSIQAQVRQTLAERDAAISTLENQRRTSEASIRATFKALQQGVTQVEAAHQAMQAASESVKSMQMGYEIGTQSLTNLVVAIGSLADSQAQYSTARHLFVENLLLLKQAAGVLTPDDLAEVNRWLH